MENISMPLRGKYTVEAYNKNWLGIKKDIVWMFIWADCWDMCLSKASMGADRKHYRIRVVEDEKLPV